MKAKEKAEELFDKMYMTGIDEYNSKQCALIAVNEIINSVWEYHIDIEYWYEVKNEIEQL